MFVSKWVICVFSYNRALLLQNLLESISCFYPEFDIAVFDDNSNDPATNEVLDSMQKKGINVIQGDADNTKSKHGGLYAQMNKALGYAIEQGYDYAYFVQDDMQFLWRDTTLETRVKEAFIHDECMMCNNSFLQKILDEGIEYRLPLVKGRLYSFEGNGVADTGIIDLQKAKRVGLHFPEYSEGGNGKYWYNKGYRLYWLPAPHLAWVPWPTTFRNKMKEARRVHILRPLDSHSIEKLKINPAYAYLEDYTSLYGFMIKPYWYTSNPGMLNLLKIYIKYYLKHIVH